MRVPAQVPGLPLIRTWFLLLAGAQLADVVTTGADLARGGLEDNRFVQGLLDQGGLVLLTLLKLGLVVAMAVSYLVLRRLAGRYPTFQARAAQAFVWRALQLCVVALVLVAAQNTAVLARIS